MSRKKTEETPHEEHADETWLIPYSDLLTLLLALFIVLFASSSLDKAKMEQITNAFSAAFSTLPSDQANGTVLNFLEEANNLALGDNVGLGSYPQGAMLEIANGVFFENNTTTITAEGKEILKKITDVIYDPTIFIKTDTYNDEIRTFCTNPGGFVAKENYYGYICVNGHALKDVKSNNSNFAFISKVNLTEPVTNTREYGESIAHIANVLGDGKPIIQTLKDLKQGRRSNWNKINKGFITPTLKDCVAGDLALVLPHRIVTNILEGLKKLDKIIPGVNNDETLLYGPEIKFFSNEIETDNHFKLKDYDVYFIGDGAGKAGNIVTAAATGLVAARDILNTNK